MKNFKKLILILIIVISILAIILAITVYTSKVIEGTNNENIGDAGEEIVYNNTKIEDVTDKVKYFTVSNCVTRYFNQIQKDNVRYYGNNEDGEYTLIVTQEEINQDNYELLSKDYIKSKNISVNTVNQYIDNIDEKVIFTPLKMKVINGYNVEKYVVYGFIQNSQDVFIKDVYLIVNLDIENKTFSIEPLFDKYSSIDDIQFESNNESIEKNDNNTYTDAKVNYETMSRQYFNTYKRMCLSNPELAYKYIENEYKTKRFSDVNSYKQYVEKNKEELKGVTIKQFMVNNYNDYTEFVCKDQYENLYIFREKSINDFDILLDTYTIMTDKFKETYETSSNQNRVMMNIDKWIQMLNNRDYLAAYNLLDETFRDNNFDGNESNFETYMREKYPLHYKVTYTNYSEQPGDLYSQEIILKAIEDDTKEEQNLTIIIKLKENMNFVMSFEV